MHINDAKRVTLLIIGRRIEKAANCTADGIIFLRSRPDSRNSSLGTATSANSNVTYRPWLTTLAPIFISFSRSVVSDPCSTSFGNADVSCGSKH